MTTAAWHGGAEENSGVLADRCSGVEGAASRAGGWCEGGCVEFLSEERMGTARIVETWFLVGVEGGVINRG